MGKNSTRARARAARDGRTGHHPKGWERSSNEHKAAASMRSKWARDAREIKHLARNQIVRGAVVWSWVPYVEDSNSGKSRPAVVVSVNFAERTVVAIPVATARASSVWWGRRSLNWEELGFSRPVAAMRRRVILPWESLTMRYSVMPEDDVNALEQWAKDAKLVVAPVAESVEK
ncbi:MAG: type II toxin-antitoxin system PemK/MazF family toxin [Actinobacteria bacterium]|nr:type II toxin-antitoxin system PemK/MazF family toxin [Actinomycetota bacterium]